MPNYICLEDQIDFLLVGFDQYGIFGASADTNDWE